MSEITPPDSRDIRPVNIEDELRQSYLDYAMSVIVGRALPDIRDGLKPVHKRVLFAMSELNNTYNRPYVKSARVVGDVIGKYHPHGDTAAYDTIVRMAQDFSMRYLLVDGQGNFGSIDADPPAAMRYTEVRMSKMASDLLADLDKDTVEFVPNYDDTLSMPEVLPTRVPTLLVNGSSGIAVGMATNIPPHNLTEVVNACLAMLENPQIDVDGLMEFVTAPDFPTGGIINGRAGVVQAYRTGRGRIYVRGRASVEIEKNGRERIIITEIPYQLNKSRLIEKIAELVKEKRIDGITELRDESDKDGLRVVVEVRRGESGEVILNNLYTQTQLQSVFGINCVALVEGQPKLVNLKEMLEAFLQHRQEVVTRRTLYLLRRARQRGHILEGQAVALANIDAVIELIKKSPSAAEARVKLMEQRWAAEALFDLLERVGSDACRPEGLSEDFGFSDGLYRLTEEQAQAILEIRLHRLTAMEQGKLMEDYQGVIDEIADLLDILGSHTRLISVIRGELEEIRTTYGDERRTEVVTSHQDLSVEDLINEEELVVTISHLGYGKTQPLDTYQAQRRGGRGKAATTVRDEDFVEHLIVANSHDVLLCFSDMGKVFWLKVFQIPQGSRGAKGRPMINLLSLGADERITAVLPIKDYAADHFVFMATANGTVKKTPLEQFSRPRPSGLIAIDLEEGNTLVGAAITNGSSDIMLCSNAAKAARFKETDVRTMGRTAKGVRGIRLGEGQRVISLIIPNEEGYLLTASENGYGKRSLITDFPIRGRGAQGVIAMQTSNRNGELVGAVQVFKGDELMLISNMGTLVRTGGDEVSIVGRNTQGVRLIKLKDGELLNSVGRIAEGSLVADTEGSDGDLSEGEKAEGVVDGGGIDAATPAEDSDTESE
ncbi:MAG: DNA gyrase subunit A [Gammaproteobacteria bacterium]|jgi:DNA gyrase subunit A|nr:DNA gyrase subunit A [Gammaproteobacteria bacterium]MBT5682119.1 DNA gyrase subunit A [Gammaproteobacteria bacterium]MBT6024643.1 DNA gyrase subunit A [Gammaproteobacteria bacterium]MBT6558894.1 DNA gyrase subunit A [Gammaproteobacteria bacterium]MDA8868345.1 DNA gyrase subunit A [Pseudomonadales bacterium]